jgi:hypothetical protein
MSEQTKPSILTQTEQVIADTPDGIRAGVLIDGKQAGAEVSAKADVGKPGGWTLGAVARIVNGKDKTAALWAKWTGK